MAKMAGTAARGGEASCADADHSLTDRVDSACVAEADGNILAQFNSDVTPVQKLRRQPGAARPPARRITV
jgi:hypothetical protein